ncbi:hypothetical protein, variant 1 [Sphaeroforma arctica JP610]|uniref:Wax synthase domain-containing protein n=1 Tax=Sphaeroforma arctica JP610 TaxID=667725 RepID=A0A0L0FGT0_9EUKA|nr:hypothetical protein, variant 1 [Sphaeroforma arctica JP610]KNC75965.1 hypothetical protein, variant 1 [Sphaeroforma arctica JP610]|eukprot:XP_014149867.1 hypothetical protein, variant 1 [Sphaeroforma arctica JP610]
MHYSIRMNEGFHPSTLLLVLPVRIVVDRTPSQPLNPSVLAHSRCLFSIYTNHDTQPTAPASRSIALSVKFTQPSSRSIANCGTSLFRHSLIPTRVLLIQAPPENIQVRSTAAQVRVTSKGDQLHHGLICLGLWLLVNVVLMSRIAQDNKQVFSFFLYLARILLGATCAFDLAGAFVQRVSGNALAMSFDAPYMSDSLADFWGRRWNLFVQEMMRRTVYIPSIAYFGKVHGLSYQAAKAVAVMTCFIVSAVAHEYIMWSASSKFTWEWFTFFIIHGVLVVLEGYAWKCVSVCVCVCQVRCNRHALDQLPVVGYS